MEEPPWGYRLPEDEDLFTQPTNDPSIEPDRISPTVEGYFRIPPIWIGDAPDPETVRLLNPSVHHAIVLKKKLHCGIEIRARRDGTFLFDFSSWPLAPTVIIPGYRIPDPNKSYRIPIEHACAEEKGELFAVLRAQVMNVHQVCLITSENVVKHRSAVIGLPVTPWNTIKAITFDGQPSYQDDAETLYALAQNISNNKDRVSGKHPLPRRALEVEVVEHSLELLDRILAYGDAILVQIIESAYIAACRKRDKRFGEAVTLAWGVCEQLLSFLWKQLLDDTQKSGNVARRMPKNRQDKLTGRDYTASVMVEMLEINGRIDHDLYRLLEIARKARNKWAHEMRVPEDREVDACIRAVQMLLRHVKDLHLVLQSGGRGGVPQWPAWMWQKVKAEGGP